MPSGFTFRWSGLFKAACMCAFPPPGGGGKCRFPAILERCQEFHLLLRRSLSLFQICLKCSIIYEVHSCLSLFPSETRQQLQKPFSVVAVNRFGAAATTWVTAGRKTLRAGTELSFHDVGQTDLQRLKE